jgi:nucleotide-binding universal stress UspA family protein
MSKVIMVPTDRPEEETTAISTAVKLAQRFNSELRFVRVENPAVAMDTVASPPVLLVTEEAMREAREARRRALEEFGSQWSARAGIAVTTALEEGPVGPTLQSHAKSFGVDLIVMSSHSRGGLNRVTLGSVTDYLIRNTSVPVIVAKASGAPDGMIPEVSFGRIVVPLDGSALAEEILPKVAELASRLESTVSLLHVLTPVTYAQKAIMQPGLPWWDDDLANAEAYLAGPAEFLRGKGITVGSEVVLSDDIPVAIMDYTIRSRADLLAIATRGAGGISRLVFGTIADEVTRKSPVSVLVYHPSHSLVRDYSPVATGRRTAAA